MHSVAEFFVIAVLVTVVPGPGTAAIMRVAMRDGRRSAFSAVVGNSIGLLLWAVLSAIGVSSLIIASETAYSVLRIGGALFLIALGLRSLFLLGRNVAGSSVGAQEPRPQGAGWKIGLATSLSNPKLAIFFVALFPQFITPGTAVLPASMLMAFTVVAFDVIWFGALIYLIDQSRKLLRPQIRGLMERIAGAALVGIGVVLVTGA